MKLTTDLYNWESNHGKAVVSRSTPAFAPMKSLPPMSEVGYLNLSSGGQRSPDPLRSDYQFEMNTPSQDTLSLGSNEGRLTPMSEMGSLNSSFDSGYTHSGPSLYRSSSPLDEQQEEMHDVYLTNPYTSGGSMLSDDCSLDSRDVFSSPRIPSRKALLRFGSHQNRVGSVIFFPYYGWVREVLNLLPITNLPIPS